MNARRSPLPSRLLPVVFCGVAAFHAFASPQDVEIRCMLPGKNKICFVVQSGKAVRKGEALVVFNPDSFLQALSTAAAAVSGAESRVQGIEDQLAALASGQDGARKPLEADQQQAARALERYQQIDQPLAEKHLRQAVADADLALRNEQDQFKWRDDLLKQGFIRKNEWEEAGLKLDRAELDAETAQANLDAHLKYEKVDQTEHLADAVRQKQDALTAWQTNFESTLKKLQASLQAASAQVGALQITRARQQDLLAQTAILAPIDGVFTPAADPDLPLGPGVEVSEGQLLGTLAPK